MNAVASSVWLNLLLTTLPRKLSNHNPLLLVTEQDVDSGRRPFGSLDVWWEHNFFFVFLQDSWRSIDASTLVDKRRILRGKLKNWNTKFFGNLNNTVNCLKST